MLSFTVLALTSSLFASISVFNVYMERKKTNPSQNKWSLTIEQTQYNEEKVDFSTNGATTTGFPHAKKKKNLRHPSQ